MALKERPRDLITKQAIAAVGYATDQLSLPLSFLHYCCIHFMYCPYDAIDCI
jgi:hypothetical protein